MAFFDNKKTSTSTTNIDNYTTGFSEVGGHVTSVQGDGNTVTDLGAIQGALDLAADVIGSNERGLKNQLELYQGYGGQLQSFAASATKSQGDQLADTIKWLIGGLVMVGIASFFRKGKA